ncbi:hypothetical protein PROVALCAL_01726 [Providencia alcalifaciens DSM 30120]|uniref:Uncharacterized protein n=1 Tax=Providencia alcalifaciens DSM 30120 TaxID=520999 RepID=B6XEE7_9GAMM|nr:hypothetical protein PROVALCAL_01726 [Providencia alcalifaciens DSM 30120]
MNKQSLISYQPYPTAIYRVEGKNLSFFTTDSNLIPDFHQLHSLFGKRFEENGHSYKLNWITREVTDTTKENSVIK